jgi:precorrin-2 dehydrogenase/sirohydrochlorin ferrochelatase
MNLLRFRFIHTFYNRDSRTLPMFYPIYLSLKNKRVIVIGGGPVAERKVESLLGTGAEIVVISPAVTDRLELLAQENRIVLRRRLYQQGDCADAALVFSATDDRGSGAAIFADATESGVPVNTADQPELCDFIMPAVVRRGDVAVAISTGGSSPGLAAQLKRKIGSIIGPEYAKFAAMLARSRSEIRRRIPDAAARNAAHERILNSDILERLKQNDDAEAERILQEIIESSANDAQRL